MLRKRMALPIAVAMSALVVAVVASPASAGHLRPNAAGPLRVSFVPAFNACASPNRFHGLGIPSCAPPVHSSTSLSIGTPDLVTGNNGPPNATGFIRFTPIINANPPPSDILIDGLITDVRCKGGTVTCGDANTVGGPDYTGQVAATMTMRISDHDNGTAPSGGGTQPATTTDFSIQVPYGVCTQTAAPPPSNTSKGASCAVNTTMSVLAPGLVKALKRASVAIRNVVVIDGGPDGNTSTGPNTVFMEQGVYLP